MFTMVRDGYTHQDAVMRASRFTTEQTTGILKEWDDGMPTQEVRPTYYGISPATLYQWKAKFGGMRGTNAQ